MNKFLMGLNSLKTKAAEAAPIVKEMICTAAAVSGTVVLTYGLSIAGMILVAKGAEKLLGEPKETENQNVVDVEVPAQQAEL